MAFKLPASLAFHHFRYTREAFRDVFTQFNDAWLQEQSSLIQLLWVLGLFMRARSADVVNRPRLFANTLNRDQIAWNFNWIFITWIHSSRRLHVAWRLWKGKILRVQMYFMYMLVLQSISWQCFQIWVSIFWYYDLEVHQILTVRESDSSVYNYRKATFDVFNRRFNNFMNDCTPGMFILSYLLDPSKHSQIKSDVSSLTWNQSTTKIAHSDWTYHPHLTNSRKEL